MANVLQLTNKPISHINIALIGLGNRGLRTIQRYSYIEGAQIIAIADINKKKINEGLALLQPSKRRAISTFSGPDAWKKICEEKDIQIIIVCTDWTNHTDIACYAMECGKHVALEVPASTSLADCFKLVETAERTQKHCIMLENCCYDYFSLSVSHLIDSGALGEIKHCEGAYIHNLNELYWNNKQGSWMKSYCDTHLGNCYPTHGIGPIAHLLNIHRGNRFDYLVSISSNDNSINNTFIKTINGETILLQLDLNTPRPYSRLQTICGTKGFTQKYPIPTLQLDNKEALIGENAEKYVLKHPHPSFEKIQELGKIKKVPNLMNFLMDYRMIDCLHKGLPMDIDVYDAAEWSAILELSEQSVRNGSMPISFPDFTHGHSNDLKGHHYQ